MVDALSENITRRFDVHERLGEGGFATVYAATDRTSGAKVALKLLKQEPTGGYDRETAGRYRREVAILERLRSPFTVRLLGHGEGDDGTLFMVFEHIDGEELGHLLARRGRLERDEILHILDQLLDALGEAHRLGLLHRDLKPANVLIHERDGDPLAVKLIDFGIARPMDPNIPTVTQTGALVGTPRYMSPEQLLKQPLSPASDIYSLGLIAFEMALGRQALQGNKFGDQIDRLLSGHGFSVPALERVGSDLHTTITKMCQRDVGRRLGTVAAVRAMLGLPAARPVIEVDTLPVGQIVVSIAVVLLLAVIAVRVVTPRHDGPRPRPSSVKRVDAVVPVTPPPSEPEELLGADLGSERPAFASWGCLEPGPVDVDMRVPRDYDGKTALPLLVVLHDVNVEPSDYLLHSGFAALADEQPGFILLAPRSPRSKGSATQHAIWSLPNNHWFDPVEEAAGRVARTLNTQCVDKRRVFAVGHGRGAEAAQRLACYQPLAGVSAIAAPHFPVPTTIRVAGKVLDCHGRLEAVPFQRFTTRDVRRGKAVLWTGDTNINELDRVAAEARKCETTDEQFRRDQRGEVCRTWTCPGEMKLESCMVDGKLAWPGMPERAESPNKQAEIRYAERVWSFFEGL